MSDDYAGVPAFGPTTCLCRANGPREHVHDPTQGCPTLRVDPSAWDSNGDLW